jgi:hypothetical protein
MIIQVKMMKMMMMMMMMMFRMKMQKKMKKKKMKIMKKELNLWLKKVKNLLQIKMMLQKIVMLKT